MTHGQNGVCATWSECVLIRLVSLIGLLCPSLDSRERERAGGLENAAGVHEAVLDRGADLVGGGGHHLVDELQNVPVIKRMRCDIWEECGVTYVKNG